MLFGVEYVMLDAAYFEHAAEQLRNLDRRGADQYRTTFADEFDYLLDYGIVLLALGLVYQILPVLADNRSVGRDDDNIQFVDVPELRCLGLRRTGHTAEFVIHAEIVLQRNRRECLRRSLDLHALFRLDCLMQTVRVAATVENTSRLFVHYFHLVVHHDVLHVLLEHRVGFEQLIDGVYALRLYRVVVDYLVLLLRLLLQREFRFLQVGDFGTDVRQHEESVLVEVARQYLVSLVGEFDRIKFLVDDEE